MHSSILFFVVFMGVLRWVVRSWHPGHPSPAAREVPRKGGGREPCHSPKYFGQPYNSLPHRLRAEPPRRGGQGVNAPFLTGWRLPARGAFSLA